jgi:uncharacterized membrane protein
MSEDGTFVAGQSESSAPGQVSLRRLERLADLIFAVALLLLLITIDFAPEDSASADEAYQHLFSQIGQSFSFVINFVIIGYYWITHQEYFSYYKRTNKVHTLIELLFLMTIAAMPFNNHFIAAFPLEIAPRIALTSDIVGAGLLAFLSWSYATAGNRLVDKREVDPEVVRFMRLQALAVPVVALVAIGVAFLHPLAWDVILTVGPLAALFLIKRRPRIKRTAD